MSISIFSPIRFRGRFRLSLWLCTLLSLFVIQAEEEAPGKSSSGKVMRVRLKDALRDGTDLGLRFTMEGEKLNPKVYGFAMFWNEFGIRDNAFNYRIHKGRIVEQRATESGWDVKLDMKIEGDPWVKGGPASYQLQIQQKAGEVSGSFSGIFHDPAKPAAHEVADSPLRGSLASSIARAIPGHRPFEPEEHPRILVRKADLPLIRQRIAETPEGQAIFARMKARAELVQGLQRAQAWKTLNYSSMYLVTGDQEWADKAKQGVLEEMKAPITASKMIWRAPRYAMVAITYDQCYDAWDPDFRLQVAQWLEHRIFTLERGGGRGYNSAPHSNWQAITKGSLGIIGMALLDDPGTFRQPPVPVAEQLASPAPLPLPEGVTAQELAPGRSLLEWLVASSFEGVDDQDRLQAAGGRASLQPKEGTEVRFGEEQIRFRRVPTDLVNGLKGGATRIRCVEISDRRPNNTSYYFSWVKVSEEQTLQVDIQHWRTSLWIGGARVNKNGKIHLLPGTYPLMMQVSIGQPSGQLVLGFKAVDHKEAEAEQANRYADYVQAKERWEQEHEAWLAKGGKVGQAEMAIEMGRIGVEDYLTSSLGDKGYPMEGDGYLAFPVTVALGPYLIAAEQAMGISYQDTTGIGDVLALQLWQTIGDRKINHGPPGWKIIDDGGEERSGTWPTLFGVTKEEHLPALKSWFDRTMGLQGNKSFGISHSTQGLMALVNYPWEVEGQAINEVMDPIYFDRYHSYLVARKGWNNAQDHVAVIHLLERPRGATHLATPYPHYFLEANGERLFSASAPQAGPVKNPKGFIGGKTLSFQDFGGGSFLHAADLSTSYIQIPTRKQIKQGAPVDPNPKAKVTRHNAVFFDEGGATIYALLDQEWKNQVIQTDLSSEKPIKVSGYLFTIEDPNSPVQGAVMPVKGDAKLKASAGRLSVSSEGGHLIVTVTSGEAPVQTKEGIQVGSRLFTVEDGELIVK